MRGEGQAGCARDGDGKKGLKWKTQRDPRPEPICRVPVDLAPLMLLLLGTRSPPVPPPLQLLYRKHTGFWPVTKLLQSGEGACSPVVSNRPFQIPGQGQVLRGTFLARPLDCSELSSLLLCPSEGSLPCRHLLLLDAFVILPGGHIPGSALGGGQ